MKKFIVTLTKGEREELKTITSKGKHKSQKIINALILLGCDVGEYQDKISKNREIAQVLKISMQKIDRVKKQFVVVALILHLMGKKEAAYTLKKWMVILKHT